MSTRTVLATGLSLALLATGLTACGSGSGSSSNTTSGAQQQRRGGPGFSNVSAKVRACLKKEGVTLPTGGQRRFNGPPNGQPPTGTNAQPPAGTNGQPPSGAGPGGNPAQFQKLRAAMAKCGVQLPQGGPPNGNGGPPPGATNANPS